MNAPELATWLKQRLGTAESDWHQLVGAMYRHLLDQPFDKVVDRGHLRALVDTHLDEKVAEMAVRLVFQAGVRTAVAEGHADQEPVGRWMPEAAQTRLMDYVATPGFIAEAWVQQLFAQDAAEELFAETLHQSLRDFSTLVPRILQKVLPSGLGKLAGFAASAGGKVFDEVERLLDGEIRRFLEKGTRRALDRAAGFAIQNMDSPSALEGRRNMVRFVLSKSGQFHLDGLTDARVDELESIAIMTAHHIATNDETKKVVDRLFDQMWQAQQGRTIREVLASVGITEEPPFDDWARVTWPVLRTAIEAPAVQQWLDGIAVEILAHVKG